LDHVYAQAGTFTVTVRVSDGQATGSATATVLVAAVSVPDPVPVPVPTTPQVSVSGPHNGVRGQDRSFAVTACGAAPGTNAAGFAFNIKWGDGSDDDNSSAQANNGSCSFSHTFRQAGTYTVTVTAKDRNGQRGSATYQVVVSAAELQS